MTVMRHKLLDGSEMLTETRSVWTPWFSPGKFNMFKVIDEQETYTEGYFIGYAITRRATRAEKSRDGIHGRAIHVTVYDSWGELVGSTISSRRDEEDAAQSALAHHLVFKDQENDD